MDNHGSLFIYSNRIILSAVFVFTFHEQLRTDCKAYFKERCHVEITDETADLYLDSLADLYECMEDILTPD
jgi:hypothetical protein